MRLLETFLEHVEEVGGSIAQKQIVSKTGTTGLHIVLDRKEVSVVLLVGCIVFVRDDTLA
jgi:hypothetical protein